MTPEQAVKIAVEIMHDAARKKYTAKVLYGQGNWPDQKNQAARYDEIIKAIEIIQGLVAQKRLKL
jgi:hypothetical protein